MLVFIDESGDPGLKIGTGSSKYFIVALVAFEDHDEALAADDRIALLRKEQEFPARFEFHFNKMKSAYRRMFLEAVARYDFFYSVVVIDKAKLMKSFKESIYKYSCGLLLDDVKSRLDNAIVVVDGSESKRFRHELKSYLVRRLKDDSGKCLVKDVRVHDSITNNLLQLADMVVGAVARSFSAKKDSHEYRKLIELREKSVEVWPK